MKTVECPSFEFKIYIAGPIEEAKQILRREALREGLCVTIEPSLYIYTGGEEQGYVVSLRNYPRFPSTVETLGARAQLLAELLVQDTYQHSAMIVGPETTTWIAKREG
jgi:hypothetical protein